MEYYHKRKKLEYKYGNLINLKPHNDDVGDEEGSNTAYITLIGSL